MKKWQKVFVGSALVAGCFVTLQSTQVLAQEATNNVEVTANAETEKDKALAAGYTEEQYNQIMNMPKLVSDEALEQEGSSLSSQQLAVLNEANKYLGVPYVWGGKTPSGFDCSGLVQYVFKQATGKDVWAPTTNQEYLGTEASLSALQAGDLLFFGNRGATYHVAIYIGNGQYIHAPQPGENVKIGNMKWFAPSFARRILDKNNEDHDKGAVPSTEGQKENERFIFRLYNSNAGSHHYTQNLGEAKNLQKAGWNYEGLGWVAPAEGAPVYRLYNPNNGRHHYTTSGGERDSLVTAGWNSEGTSWNSGGNVPVYRVYNPYAQTNADSHHYTTSAGERNNLVKIGWRDEGIGWYALKAK